jgi:uncharacterized spore protein YtfJ
MDPHDLLAQARDTITVKRVFGDPYEKDGVTFIPAAVIIGGLGGGEGAGAPSEGAEAPRSVTGAPSKGAEPPRSGTGAGAGLIGWPAGAYVIKDGDVSWRPALNVNLVILGGQLVGLVALLAARTILKAWVATRG